MAFIYSRTLPRIYALRNILYQTSSPVRSSKLFRLSASLETSTAAGSSMFSSDSRNSGSNVFRKLNNGLTEHHQTVLVLKRNYGGKPPLSLKTINDRVMLILQLFDKINPEKITLDSHFMKDLGLDSLDHVEIMLQLEREFAIEIPDADAEELVTPRKIVQYICDAEDIYE